MNDEKYVQKARTYLDKLCSFTPSRRMGSPGNRLATDYVAEKIGAWDFSIDATPFPCLDFRKGKSSLRSEGREFAIHASPYSLGCDVEAELEVVSTIEELESCDCAQKILLMQGEICAEQLMPKNFVFYNPDHHKKIYALLEEVEPIAIITATSKNPGSVGALYPYPLFEDGDFDIPSAYCSDTVGQRIAETRGESFALTVKAERLPTTACNVIAAKMPSADKKIVVCAHIDTKEKTPGASDNASGIVIQLLLAEMLAEYSGAIGMEIIAFNGEDHYSAGGQMDYLRRYGQDMDKVLLAINMDGVGYFKGKTAYSFYECPDNILEATADALGDQDGIISGNPWYQGDHMLFVQNKRPALAITSEKNDLLLTQITHTSKDTSHIIDCRKLVHVATGLQELIRSLSRKTAD